MKHPEDTPPDRVFHLRYQDIVGSLGYLVNMTRPDEVFPYSELSKYVQCPPPSHISVLGDTCKLDINYHRDPLYPDKLWGWVDEDWEGGHGDNWHRC